MLQAKNTNSSEIYLYVRQYVSVGEENARSQKNLTYFSAFDLG